MAEIEELRERAGRHLEQGQAAMARANLRELWRIQPTAATAGFILNCQARYSDIWPVTRYRVAVIRSFTVEPLFPLLKASALLEGLDLSIEVGLFNAFAQELLDASSSIYHAQPQVVIMAVQSRDLVPELWESFSGLDSETAARHVTHALEQMEAWVSAFRQHSTAHLIIHNFERPVEMAQGILDGQTTPSQNECFRQLNDGVKRLAASVSSVSVLDYDGLIGRHGRETWFDPRKWATARFPIAASCLPHLPLEWLRFLYALAGPIKKVLVTDLDNTMWGGLAGEDGLNGIKLGTSYSDSGYRALQSVMLDLYHRGILLAINSKNNDADANRIIESHPGMLLSPKHFSASRINWQDKAQNLREIAAELNVGLDSMVFLDDNPAERQWVRMETPEVTVIELPTDPMLYAASLRNCPYFERLSITEEDRMRQQQYQQQRSRVEMHQAATSLEEFYWSLRQVVSLAPLQPTSVARAAQLTLKTNQFNVTTKRYSEETLRSISQEQGSKVWTVNVTDRFGDNGLVGVVITRSENRICEIDTFLLSCRVIGRKVESAILAHLLANAASQRFQELRGSFVATNKNAPSATLYQDHGFVETSRTESSSYWAFDLTKQLPACPPWIEWRLEEPTFVEACATH